MGEVSPTVKRFIAYPSNSRAAPHNKNGEVSLDVGRFIAYKNGYMADLYEQALKKFRSDERDNGTLAQEIGLPKETVRDIRSGHVEYPRLPTLRLIAAFYEKAS